MKQQRITEKAFQSTVIKALRLAGWVHYHTFNSMRSVKGFPDLIAIHEKQRRILAIELKSETGKLTPEQEEWLRLFSLCSSVESEVLRPSGFDEFWERIK